MAHRDSLYRIATAIGIAMASWLQPAAAREPPAAGCIDLHDLDGGWRSGDREILSPQPQWPMPSTSGKPACARA